MGFPKILVVAVALVALGGFGVAAVAPEAIIGQGEEPLSFTVPLSRVGDRVVYEVYTETNHTTTQQHEHHDAGPRTHRSAFQISRLDTTLDWHGNVRDVAVVKSSVSISDEIEPPTRVVSIDREERIGIRSAIIWPESTAQSALMINASLAYPVEPPMPFVEVQGQRLELQQDVPLAPILRGKGGGYGGGGGGGVYVSVLPELEFSRVNLAFRTQNDPLSVAAVPQEPGAVLHQGTVDGRPALALAAERLETVQEPGHGGHGGRALDVRERTLAWFTPDVPYPVLVETTLSVSDSQGNLVSSTEATRWLAEFQPGTGPTAWGPAHDREPIALERTPDQHYPADGSATTIAYPLSEAVRDIQQLPPPEFTLWQQSHPDALLVSATMTPATHQNVAGPGLDWRLTFAEPSGAGFQVLAERLEGAAVPYLEALGETQTRPFTQDDLPVAPVTFGQAAALWRQQQDGPTTYAHWGLVDVVQDTSRSCVVTTGHSSGDEERSTRAALATLVVGQADWGACFAEDNRHEMEGVVLDASRGLLLASFQVSYDMDEHDQVPMGFPSGPGKATVTSPAAAGAPTVVLSSLASSSLLVIIITVYLLPHIKWFGTQALLFVPGFSKLKKDRLLDHKLRERLNETIKANPGISPSELQRQTGTGWGTIVHHLTIMERNGLVTSAVDGRHRRYFPHLPGGETAARREAVLGNDNTQRVLSLVLAEPGIPTSAIANELGMSTAGAMWHLGRLTEAGFVDRRKEGRSVRYFPDQPPMTPARPYDPKEAVEVV